MTINIKVDTATKEMWLAKEDALVKAFQSKTPAELDAYIDNVATLAEIKTVLKAVLKHLYILHRS